MRPLALRHPWMIIAPAAIVLFFALSMYDTYRTPPVLCNLESNNFIRKPIFTFPLLLEATNLLKPYMEPFMDIGEIPKTFHVPVGTDTVTNITTAESETVRDFVNRNQKALALILESTSKPSFAHYGELAKVCHYTNHIVNYQSDPYISVLNDWHSVFSLYPVTMLTKANMLNAALDHDAEAFMEATDLAFATAALPTKSLMFPDTLLVSMDAYFVLLDTMNWAVNHLSLNAAQLQHLRDILARDCSKKSAIISDAWHRRLVYAKLAYEEAKRMNYLPPVKEPSWDRRYSASGRMPFEYGFRSLRKGWLSFDTLAQLTQLHHARYAMEADSFAFNQGEHDHDTKHQAIPAKYWINTYATKGSNYSQEYDNATAATAIRDDLFDRQQVLWPYRKYYEPYPEVLAHARAMDTALASRQYLLDKGVFPNTLEKLLPDYMEALPMDPYGFHQPLEYENHGHYIRISSICQSRLFKEELNDWLQSKRRTAGANGRFNGVLVFDTSITPNGEQQ